MKELRSIEDKVSTLFSNLPKYTQEAIAACIRFTLAEFRDEVKGKAVGYYDSTLSRPLPAVPVSDIDAVYNRLTGGRDE